MKHLLIALTLLFGITASAVEDVTDNTFQEKVMNSKGYVFVDVYATWCGPCKELHYG